MLTFQRYLTFRNAHAHIWIFAMTTADPGPRKRGPYADLVDECKAAARDGAAKVHAAAATPTPKTPRTDAESAALARKRLDEETR